MKKLSILLCTITAFTFSGCFAQVKNVKHVIFIGGDGMGAYSIDKSENATMQMMMKNGAYSLKAKSCLPSSSAPNWASHLTGASPEQHGYKRWNSRKPEFVSNSLNEYGMYPTIFYALKKQKPRLTSAAVYEWEGIPFLYEPECVNKQVKGEGDLETTTKAMKVIEELKPNFLFIHLNGPDSAGHTIGFNSPEFYQKVKNTDAHIASIIEATKKAGTYNNTVFLISADHGGKGTEHGEDSPAERQVPWILYGKPVKKKGEIKSNIMVYDTAPTIAWLLGLNPLKAWIGKAVKSPF